MADELLPTAGELGQRYAKLVAPGLTFCGHTPALRLAADEYKRIEKKLGERYQDKPVDDHPSLQIAEVIRGPWPRPGVDAALELVREIEQSAIPHHMAEFVRGEPVAEPWPSGSVLRAVGERVMRNAPVRSLARVWAARMRLAAIEGRRGDAAVMLEQMLAMGNACRAGLTFYDRLAGDDLVGLALGELRCQIVEGLHDEASLRACDTTIDRLGAGPEIRHAFEAEREIQLACMAEIMAREGTDSPEKRREVIAAIDLALRDGLAALEEPIAYKGMKDNAADPLAALGASAREISKSGATAVMLRQLPASFAGAAKLHARALQELRATRVMIAVERGRLAGGRYPQRLEELVPAYLAVLPQDPLTAKPFFYSREGDAMSPGAYKLYSAGVDLRDDAGRADPEDPWRALTRDGAGLDYVINGARRGPWKPRTADEANGSW